jgi:hypothetical protein
VFRALPPYFTVMSSVTPEFTLMRRAVSSPLPVMMLIVSCTGALTPHNNIIAIIMITAAVMKEAFSQVFRNVVANGDFAMQENRGRIIRITN